MSVAGIELLLEERPQTIGLAASGMPECSSGMEMGTYRKAHDVELVRLDGPSEVWSPYSGKHCTQSGRALARFGPITAADQARSKSKPIIILRRERELQNERIDQALECSSRPCFTHASSDFRVWIIPFSLNRTGCSLI